MSELSRVCLDSKESKKNTLRGLIIVFSLTLLIICSTQAQGQSSKKSGWELITTDTELDILNVISTEGNEVWGFGESGLMMHSDDKGHNWNIFDSITNENLTSSDYLNGNLAIAGSNGLVMIKRGVSEWLDLSIPDNSIDLKDIAISSDDYFFVIGDKGTLWNYDGDAWENISMNGSMQYNSISFIDDNNGQNGIIVGNNGLILTTIDQGVTWDIITPPDAIKNSNIISIELFSNSKAYATTQEGRILVSRNLETSIGFEWDLVTEEKLPDNNIQIVNIDVINPLKIIITGTNNYIATSKDGGNTVEEHNISLIPLEMNWTIYDIEMIDGFCGVLSGSQGIILVTGINEDGCTEGLDQTLGFQIEEFNKFGKFADKYSSWMLDGLIATMKIVGFGILFGFIIGITLAMLKTAPTSLKDMLESHLERVIFFSWFMLPLSVLLTRQFENILFSVLVIITLLLIIKLIEFVNNNNYSEELSGQEGFFGLVISSERRLLWTRILGLSYIVGIPNIRGMEIRGGFAMIFESVISFKKLDLSGVAYIFAPIGDPMAFSYFILGIFITFPGLLLLTSNGKYSNVEIPYLKDKKIVIKPWELRPLNSLATLYTDMFRNTPLVVQFLFLHFGIEIGKRIENAADGIFDNIPYLADIFSDRIYLSAICALAMNSGAYQCETLRGAIAAIPSGQMEAGRSIGLTYLQTMRLIILPQSIRICIPPLGNEMVNLVLNSSLAMVIGYTELTRQGKLINAITFQITWTWGMVMISYFVVTWTLALILRRIEVKTKIPGLGIV